MKVVDGPHTVICVCAYVCVLVKVTHVHNIHTLSFRVNKGKSNMCIEDQCSYNHVIW